MKRAIRLIILTTVLFISGFSNEGTWVIDSTSRLTIHGSTNVNTFTCQMGSYTGHDTLHYFKNYSANELQFTSNLMTIPVRNFDCGSKQVSKDFWDTLKSDKYPKLDINFISLQSTAVKDNSFVIGLVDITLAGVTSRYSITFGTHIENGTLLLSGNHPVNFGDFRLKAPKKLQGLIRVQEVLNVEFHLVLKEV